MIFNRLQDGLRQKPEGLRVLELKFPAQESKDSAPLQVDFPGRMDRFLKFVFGMGKHEL